MCDVPGSVNGKYLSDKAQALLRRKPQIWKAIQNFKSGQEMKRKPFFISRKYNN